MANEGSGRAARADRPRRARRRHIWPALVLGVACLSSPVATRAESGVRAAAAATPSVHVEGDRLTLSVEGVSFHAMLQDIAKQAGIEIHIDPAAEDSIISAELCSLPLETSLRDLLSGYDTFFLRRASEQQPSVLRSIWVYPPGAADGLVPQGVCPDEPAGGDPLGDLDSTVAAQRVRALALVAVADDELAVRALERGLHDEDEVVRYQALVTMGQRAMVVSDADANRILASDPSPLVRQQVLENIVMLLGSTDDRVRLVAEAALNDRDDAVRELAKNVLDVASRPREPSTAPSGDAEPTLDPAAAPPADPPPPDDPTALGGD